MKRELKLKLSTVVKAIEKAKKAKADKIVIDGVLGKFTIEDEPEFVNVCLELDRVVRGALLEAVSHEKTLSEITEERANRDNAATDIAGSEERSQ